MECPKLTENRSISEQVPNSVAASTRTRSPHEDIETLEINLSDVAALNDEIKPHDFKIAIASVAFSLNQRRDYINNRFQMHVHYPPQLFDYPKMELILNEKYKFIEQQCQTDVRMRTMCLTSADATQIGVGLYIVILDRFKDPIGRFKRARLVSPPNIVVPDSSASYYPHVLLDDVIVCQLLDGGNTITVPGDQAYFMLQEFLQYPPKTITIQLRDREFQGHHRFGRVLEVALIQHSDLTYLIDLDGNSRNEPYEVELFVPEIKESINQVVLNRLCTVDADQILPPIRGYISNQIGYISSYTESGRVFIRYITRATKVIEACLRDVQEIWDSYESRRFGELQKDEVLAGQVCLGVHPSQREVRRCKAIGSKQAGNDSEGPMTLNSFYSSFKRGSSLIQGLRVQWIDWGDESWMRLDHLLPTQHVNPVLQWAAPQAQEYQLVNIRSLSVPSSYLDQLCRHRSEVTVRIVEVPNRPTISIFPQACPAPNKDPPKVELTCTRQNAETLHLTRRSVNDKLLYIGEAEAKTGIKYEFVRSKTWQPEGLFQLSLQYQTWEWLGKPEFSSLSMVYPLQNGDRISCYVSIVESADHFIIHPWSMKRNCSAMRKDLQTSFECLPWVVEDLVATEMRVKPWESFAAYYKNGAWHRAKIVKEEKKVEETVRNTGLGLANRLLFLLLIDEARYVRAEYSSVARVLPFVQFLSLGPQGAVARWEHAVELRKKAAEMDVKTLQTNLKKLTENLKQRVGTHKRVTAYIKDFSVDANGLACMVLAFED